MSILTIENLFTFIILGLLLPIAFSLNKKYKSFLHPTKDSIYFSKKDIFYENTFSDYVKPIFVQHIKNYFLRMTENEESFQIFEKFINLINKNCKGSFDNNFNDDYKVYHRKNLKNHIDNSETYDSIFSELDPKEINKWIKNINQFRLYPKCVRNYKILTYYSFIAFGILICSLIVFDLFIDEQIVYFLYLGVICLTYLILAILYIISHYKCFKLLNEIYEQNYNQKIPIKS